MKPTWRFFTVFTVLAFLMQSCALLPRVSGDLAPKSPNTVLFQDDFSDKNSGWVVLRDDQQTIDYEGGGLHFIVNQTRYDFWSVANLNLGDVHVEVDATKLAGPDDNDYGILCRFQDGSNFYGFLISSDGYYGITKMKAGEHTVISSEKLQVSDKILPGVNVNRIGAKCTGSTLELFVNGERLAEAQDGDFLSGDVGLLAGTFDDPGVDILFDNFIVTRP